MTVFYAEIARKNGFRDDNFQAGWTPTSATLSTDGDIATVTGTGGGPAIVKNLPSLSTTTYPFAVVRVKSCVANSQIIVNESGPFDSITLGQINSPTTIVLPLTSGRTTSNIVLNAPNSGDVNKWDYVAICGQRPITVSKVDLEEGEVIRATREVSQCSFVLDNSNGKFAVPSSARYVNWADHLRVWAGSGNTLFRVFGGYCEWRRPKMDPAEHLILKGLGWAQQLKQILVLKEYLNNGVKAISNDIMSSFVNAAGTNYQISNVYNQFPTTNVPYWTFLLKNAYDSLKELADYSTALGSPMEVWVDESENLHVAPVNGFGSDPIPTVYGTPLKVGANIIHQDLGPDTFNLKNRLHYFAIAQYPADGDLWTEESGTTPAGWAFESLVQTTGQFVDETTLFKVGARSIHAKMTSTANPGVQGSFTYVPSNAIDGFTSIDVTKLGSKQSPNVWRVGGPPIVDFYFREHVDFGVGGTDGTSPATDSPAIFFSSSAGNATYYMTVANANAARERALTDTQGDLNQDQWYHVVTEIGPLAGDRFIRNTSGTTDWTTINKIGFFWKSPQGIVGGNTLSFYVDGLRIQGGRYRIAFDNRATYPDGTPVVAERREIPVFDPVAKGEDAILQLSKAELFRLRNPIVRGSIVSPLLSDLSPGQMVTVNIPHSNFNNASLRSLKVTHHFNKDNFISVTDLTDDILNSNPLEPFKLVNMLTQHGHAGHSSREFYDLKSAAIDPSFTPIITGYT